MEKTLAIVLVVYLFGVMGVAVFANRKIQNEEDYIVAGRRLPAWMATFTLFATWFGAGTLLTATNEIRSEGLRVSLLEPYGSGAALLLAGWFFAGPLWHEKLCTLSDLYRRRFGRGVEVTSVLISVPGYIGWIAVQLISLAQIADLIFHIPVQYGIGGIAVFTAVYTYIGGMWSVTLTDVIQFFFVVLGLVVLGYEVFVHLGEGNLFTGVTSVLQNADPADLVILPRESWGELFSWVSVFVAASIGNIPGQDLAQRIFSSNSEKTAKRSCFWAGILYIGLGTIPVLLGLAAKEVLPAEVTDAIIPALGLKFLTPTLIVILVLGLISVILSTLDSAILAPASTLARNLLRGVVPERVPTLLLLHFSVFLITLSSTVLAYLGEDAYSLLESSYAMSLVGLFVPLVASLYIKSPDAKSVIASMITGIGIWAVGTFGFDGDAPISLIAVLAAFAAFCLAHLYWAREWPRFCRYHYRESA